VTDAKAPSLQVSPQRAELGPLAQGRAYVAQFVLRNRTFETIVIRRVELSCACTSHAIDRIILAPGEQARLDLTWATRTARGAVSTHADVYFTVGNGKLERVACGVAGHVVPNIRVEPESLVFTPDVAARQRVVLTPQNIAGFRVLDVGGTHPALRVTLLPEEDSSAAAVLEVEFDPSRLRTPPRHLEVVVITDDPVVPRLRLLVIVRRPPEQEP
jgi:hypothetical protein